MARSSATMSDKVLDHFMTAELDMAVEDLRVAKRVVQNRQAAETPAAVAKPKTRAKRKPKTPAVTGTGTGTGLASMAATVNK